MGISTILFKCCGTDLVYMKFLVEIEREEDGRWIAEIVDLPGTLAYGTTSDELRQRFKLLPLVLSQTALNM